MAPPASNLYNDPILIKEGTYPIYYSFFFQAGLIIPFDPLFVDFLHDELSPRPAQPYRS